MLDALNFGKQAPVPTMANMIDDLAVRTEAIDSMREPMDLNLPGHSKPLPETKTAKKVEQVKMLLQKYGKTSEEDLLKEILLGEDQNDLITYRVLFTGFIIKSVLTQAIAEIKIEQHMRGYTYIDKFIEEYPSPLDVTCMTVEETAQLHLDWCSDQGIDAGDMLMKMFCVLDKSFSKLNCFM